jgi:hypothetical protein
MGKMNMGNIFPKNMGNFPKIWEISQKYGKYIDHNTLNNTEDEYHNNKHNNKHNAGRYHLTQ